MAPKAKARTKAKATAKARAAAQRVRDEQLERANARQKLRRQAVQELNKLTVEIQVAARPLCLNNATGSLVEKRVRLLQRRCPDDAFRTRLRDAAQMYTDNGGTFSVPVVQDEEHGITEMPLVTS